MTRKRKPVSRKRRWLLAGIAAVLAVMAAITLTEPRQLPAAVADHQGVRVVYGWRDRAAESVYNWFHPLARLREDRPAKPTAGTGYSDQARDALDELIEEKEDTAP